MLATHEQNARIKLATIIVSVMVIAGVVVLADHLKAKNSTTATTLPSDTSSTTQPSPTASSNTPPTNATPTTPDSPSSTATSSFKDGTYTASSDYPVPDGTESIQVSVTLQGGLITTSSIQNSEGDRDSAQFQEDFASVYQSHVVGKKISGLRLSNLAGASDTAQGFNEALSQITTKAQA